MKFGFHSLIIATQVFGDVGGDLDYSQGAEEQEQMSVCNEEKTSQKLALRGIVITSETSLLENGKYGDGVHVDETVHLVGSVENLQKHLTPVIANREIDQKTLFEIKQEITDYYYQKFRTFVNVEIPEQDVSSGVVSFRITEICVGKVSYSGNKWFSAERTARKLHLDSGECVCESDLLNNITWLNKNPFHYTRAILSPGLTKNTSDVEIVTKDRFPLRFFVGGDNTGVESTGKSRFYTGVTWGDAFFVDDLLSYQFTSNSSYDKFHSHTLHYNSFLPWKHEFVIYGGYARIHPDIDDFTSEGKDAQASLRYRIPIKPFYTPFNHEFYFGFDYKYITNILFFVGELSTPVQNSIVNVTQGVLGYRFEYTPKHHELLFLLEVLGSPARWLPHQTNEAYSDLRSDAKPRYIYGTLTLGDIYTFDTKEAFSFLFRAQGSANTLIPSEQFKLGGFNSVRGYEENVFISDNGVCMNVEIRSRPLAFSKRKKEALTFLAFMDYGWGYNYHEFDGIKKTATLWGVGPGLRFNISPYFNLRADYGFKLHSVNFDDNSLGMFHIGAVLGF